MPVTRSIPTENRFKFLLDIEPFKIPVVDGRYKWRYECLDDDGVRFCEDTLDELYVRVLAHRRKRVLERAGYKCENCYQGPVQIHHKIHRSQGGKDTVENMVSYCGKCHENTHRMSGLHRKLRDAQLSMSAQERLDYNLENEGR